MPVAEQGLGALNPGANCNQRYAYEWDEYNRLTRARRWDGANLGTANDPLPETAAAADLVYAYNGADSRTRTTVVHPGVADDVHTLYIYASLELRRTGFDGENNDYLLDATHERVYLGANGERLASLRPDEAGLPAYTGEARVFFEFADHLGSANTVVDKRTGELVEKRTYTAYGSIESDHRQDRWGQFREDYGFTTKEEDVEVGLTYFGKRFYNPRLGRWLNADPLAVHSPGEADLNLYAYVHGRVFATTDPLGLAEPVSVEELYKSAESALNDFGTNGFDAPKGGDAPKPTTAPDTDKVRANAGAPHHTARKSGAPPSSDTSRPPPPKLSETRAHPELDVDRPRIIGNLWGSPSTVVGLSVAFFTRAVSGGASPTLGNNAIEFKGSKFMELTGMPAVLRSV